MTDIVLTAACPGGYRRTGPPLGIACLASILRRDGFSVKIIDPSPLNMPQDQVAEAIEREDPFLTGIYCTTMDRYEAFSLSSEVKSRLPGTLVAMGGPHVTFLAEATLEHIPSIDVVVRGEGDLAIKELGRSIS